MAETVVEALSLGTTQRFDVLFGVYESDTHAKDRLRLLTGEGGWQDWHGGVRRPLVFGAITSGRRTSTGVGLVD